MSPRLLPLKGMPPRYEVEDLAGGATGSPLSVPKGDDGSFRTSSVADEGPWV